MEENGDFRNRFTRNLVFLQLILKFQSNVKVKHFLLFLYMSSNIPNIFRNNCIATYERVTKRTSFSTPYHTKILEGL